MDKRIGDRERQGTGDPVALEESCRWFLNGYSGYRDAGLDVLTRASVAAHLGTCPSCRRYDHVIRKGVAVLRDTPSVLSGRVPQLATVRDRAWALERREAMALGTAGSGMTAAAALAVAVLLGAVAWSPLLGGGPPEVEMPPVVAGAPPGPSGPVFFPLPGALPFDVQRDELGEIARSMLVEYGRNRARPAARGVATAPDSE